MTHNFAIFIIGICVFIYTVAVVSIPFMVRRACLAHAFAQMAEGDTAEYRSRYRL